MRVISAAQNSYRERRKPKSPLWKYFAFEAGEDEEIMDANKPTCKSASEVFKRKTEAD